MKSEHKKTFFLKTLFLLIGIGIPVYWYSFQAGFQMDDYKLFGGNLLASWPIKFKLLWRYDPTRFLPHITLALNYSLNQADLFAYHLVNFTLHILCAFLVFIFIQVCFETPLLVGDYTREKKGIISLFASLIFLVHPLQTEAVTYIVQRSTVMVAIFYIAAVLCYLLYRLEGKVFWYGLAFLSAILGSVTKPNITTLPLALALVEFLFFGFSKHGLAHRLRLLSPFCILFFLVPLFLMLWKTEQLDLTKFFEATFESEVSRYSYLLTQFNVIVLYIILLFFPLQQNFDYDFRTSERFFEFPTLISFIVIVYIFLRMIKAYKEGKSLLVFGVMWFFITLLIESSIFPLSDVIFEHRLYLPMVGYGVFICTLLVEMIKNDKKATRLLIVIVLALSVLAMHRNWVWSDSERFLKDTISKSPNKLRPIYQLSNYYLRNGDMERAIAQCKQIVQILPEAGFGYFSLGLLYQKKKDLGQAELFYKQAIMKDEKSVSAYCNLANLYTTQGKYSRALPLYRKAIELDPEHINGRNGLATLYSLMGDYPRAILEYKENIQRHPHFIPSYSNLAGIYILLNDLSSAEGIFKKGIAIDAIDERAVRILNESYNDFLGLKRNRSQNNNKK